MYSNKAGMTKKLLIFNPFAPPQFNKLGHPGKPSSRFRCLAKMSNSLLNEYLLVSVTDEESAFTTPRNSRIQFPNGGVNLREIF